MAERITAQNFEEKINGTELPVLVDFYSDSCVPCKQLSPVLGDLEEEYEEKQNEATNRYKQYLMSLNESLKPELIARITEIVVFSNIF